jgi:uncharacterized protein (TIGR02453 family)
MASKAHITPELFRFFRQLERNNEREWFQKNKTRYETLVRDPLLAFVSDFATPLHKISQHLVADPRPNGGALFRIYRDVRFSKDKTPYKTAAGVRFPHEDGKSVHAPGLYLHLEPGSVFAAAGVWHPEAATLRSVRDAIVTDPKGFTRSISGKAFKAQCELGGDALKRPPKGYDPEHALIEHLKRKDFIASVAFSEADACAADFPKKLAGAFRALAPFNGFLTRAVGASW